MNDFSVDFAPELTPVLAAIWYAATDRNAVTRATHAGELLLAADPVGCGEHLSEGAYRLVVPPLVFVYEIDPVCRHVLVGNLALVRQPPAT